MKSGQSVQSEENALCEARYDDVVDGRRWVCVRSLPNREFFAAENLQRQAFECFVPMIVKKISHARRTHMAKSALFPGYLFVSIDLEVQPWRSILGTFGVSSLIMQGEAPKLIPVGVVEALQQATHADGSADFRRQLAIGQDVRFRSGPFANFVGRLDGLDARGRVAVLLDVLGGQRLVSACEAELQPVVA